ncbi:Levodione reductase [Pseudovibrio axinellae]|uniref:Levodione reductase n=1 Tax=Pseudovibrio axinellae TaxID=989403 RepID=A0A165T3C8_9HYPH|nr:SDR family oxidoreductase [Pseudovibrio axinellae]KZL05369.1 Levodione reductase [Pseudovibrio axinellae]SER36911.1 3-hydroxybutyrate dehydrogenase/3-oxoacyl-[acyl-carrier protein] reductase [Pseudovibrio axinellae]
MERTAVVTGASKGLGYEFARNLAAKGYRLAICSTNKCRIEQTADQLRQEHPSLHIYSSQCDMTDPKSAEAFFQKTHDVFGRLDLTINNVGYLKKNNFICTSFEEWDRSIRINLYSCYLGCKYSFKYMIGQAGVKNILNVSSLSGIRFVQKFKGMSAYIASKHGVVGLTESLAVEGNEYNIKVNCIAPGSIKTEMFRDNFPGISPASTPENVATLGLQLCENFSTSALTGVTVELTQDTL